jgi:hypothetical protein
MAEVDFRIVEKKENPDGRQLWLVERSDGSQTVMLPRPSGKDKVRVELMRQLRSVQAASADLALNGLITLQGIKVYEDRVLLDLGRAETLWANWELGLPERITPVQAADLLRKMVSVIEKLQQKGVTEWVFHPADLVNLGADGFGVIDAQISDAFQMVDPVRPHRELCLPPEVIQSQSWSAKGMLYTAGLAVYTALCGVFPFKMGDLSESTSAVLGEKPLDPRCYAPETSERFAGLIQALLEKNPVRRLDIEQVKQTLGEMTEDDILASSAEQEAFRAKTEAIIVQREKTRRLRQNWRIGRWIALGVVIVAAIILFSRPGYQPKITKETPPQKVVDQFYTAYAKLDVLSLSETLYKTGKDIEQMVSSAYVLSCYNMEQKARKVLVLSKLQTQLKEEKPNERHYQAQYQLVLYNSGGRDIQQRHDRLILRPVKGIWRIVDLKSKIVIKRFIKDANTPDRLDKLTRKR